MNEEIQCPDCNYIGEVNEFVERDDVCPNCESSFVQKGIDNGFPKSDIYKSVQVY